MVIWNLSIDATQTAYGRGVRLASISYSTGTDTSGVGSIIFDGTLAEAVWSGTYTGTGYQNNINGLTAQNVKAVKMAYTASYNPGGDYIGLSEVRFVGTAVPEPSTLAGRVPTSQAPKRVKVPTPLPPPSTPLLSPPHLSPAIFLRPRARTHKTKLK
jgi:hypothetical protein